VTPRPASSGDLQVHRPGASLLEPLPIAVAAVLRVYAAFTVGGSADTLRDHLHHTLHDVRDHFSQEIGVRPSSRSSSDAMQGLAIRVLRVEVLAW
jgi:hypothetical protein